LFFQKTKIYKKIFFILLMEKLNQLKFGFAGAITGGVFVLLAEILLMIKLVPWYNSLMINIYGVAGLSGFDIFKIIFISVIIALAIGFAFAWLFAWLYNKMLMIRVK